MAARSIGSLTISFGLVAIPVKLYSATQSANAISFNLLHKGCGSRLKQQYVCAKDGSLVERDDMVKVIATARADLNRWSNQRGPFRQSLILLDAIRDNLPKVD